MPKRFRKHRRADLDGLQSMPLVLVQRRTHTEADAHHARARRGTGIQKLRDPGAQRRERVS